MNIEDYVTASEAGKILNVNRARIGVLCREGRFEGAKKISLGWVIPRESVRNFKRLPPGLKKKIKITAEIEEAIKNMKDGEKNEQRKYLRND